MGEQRLSNIAILNIDRETKNFVVKENMMDIIIDEFARKNDDQARLLCHTQSPLARQSQASMTPLQTMFLGLYGVLRLKITWRQIFSHAEIFSK